jgi:hypothetical protein
MDRIVLALSMAIVLVLFGCSKKGPEAGSERGPCYGNKTCNEGLICLSDLCVRPPPADCDKVVEKLGFLTLSNYAPRSQRKQLREQLVPLCKNAHLSERDGDCILGAKNKRDLKKCKIAFLAGDCKRMLDHVRKVIASKDAKLEKMLARQTEAKMLSECERLGVTKADEACVLGASTPDQLKSCSLGL